MLSNNNKKYLFSIYKICFAANSLVFKVITSNNTLLKILVFNCPGKLVGIKRMESLKLNNTFGTINWWSKDPMKENSDIYYHIDNQHIVKVWTI